MIEQFSKDVELGLSNFAKTLPSRYFYDEIGDKLFVDIMNMPEYYLTDSEFEIFKNQSQNIIDGLEVKPDEYFELIELGAGDGTKTKELLKELVAQGYNFDYSPIDISSHALVGLSAILQTEIPSLHVTPKQGDYFEVLHDIKASKHKKCLLFLGSNMGNMSDEEARQFIYQLGANLKTDDKLLLGVDLIKSKDIVLPAYDDAQNITSKFNLNLLHRINKELDGEFELDHFEHQPEYEEEEGIAKSFLVSTKTQSVHIKSVNRTFDFKKGEKIHTEISRKYNDYILNQILEKTDFTITEKLTDSKNYFADYILTRE